MSRWSLRWIVLRVEEVVQTATARLLLATGRPVHVHAIPGIATGEAARLGGRVLVGGDPARHLRRLSSTAQVLRANLAPFLTAELPGARVRVDLACRSVVVVADREGYVEARFDDIPLAPGRHRAMLTPVRPAGEPVAATVHVPDPSADLAVVSDIDDTIVDSGVASGLLTVLRVVLLSDPSSRLPFEGAPALYRALERGPGDGPPRPFVYLSTSPWNLVGFLEGFLERHGFPAGPLALTDWGPGNAGLWRVGAREHKLSVLRRLAAHLPGMRFVLLGDSGQLDPEIYTTFALEHPGRVAAVYIRRAGIATPARQQRLDDCAARLRTVDVRFVVADHSETMLAAAREAGLASPGVGVGG